jgi:biopolymer transport protein ExbD
MKSLLTILSIFIISTSFANNFEGIQIGSTGKSQIEAKYVSKKATTAVITITNQAGVVVNTMNVTLAKGNNKISLVDVTTLGEGTYTVSLVANNTTTTAKFVNFKMDNEAL